MTGCLNNKPISENEDTQQVSHINTNKAGPTKYPLVFEVEILQKNINDKNSGQICLKIRNEGEEAVRFSAGPVPPFGVLTGQPRTGDRGFLLWNDKYHSNSHVQFTRDGIAVASIAQQLDLMPDQSISRVYEINRNIKNVSTGSVSPGVYRLVDQSGLGLQFGPVSYSVDLRIKIYAD